MSSSPSISRVLAIPLSSDDQTGSAAGSPGRSPESLAIAIILDSGQVAWGECGSVERDPTEPSVRPFAVREGVEAVRKVLAPALEGERLSEFRALDRRVEELQEVYSTTSEARVESEEPHVSRRDFITGRFLLRAIQSEVPPKKQKTTHTRPLHPVLRYVASQALLNAVAISSKRAPAQVLNAEFELMRAGHAPGLYGHWTSWRTADALALLLERLDAIGLDVSPVEDDRLVKELVDSVQRIRELIGQLPTLGLEQDQPAIHLRLNGALGTALAGNTGRMLGVLLRLEQAATPYRLRVEDPVMESSTTAKSKTMKVLKDYLEFRNSKVELVACAGILSRADVELLAAGSSAHMLHLNPSRLGGLSQTIEAAQAARRHGLQILLGSSPGDTLRSLRIRAELAVALQSELVMLPPRLGAAAGPLLREVWARSS